MIEHELHELRTDNGWRLELRQGQDAVSGLWIVDRGMRIGSATVRVGGIAGVETKPKYRRRGLSRRVMEAAVRLMQREGYDASFLYGIQDFYDKFGFATCMAEHRFSVQTSDVERCRKVLRTRKARKKDLPAIARLFNAQEAQRTGSVRRNPQSWRGFPMGSGFGIPTVVQAVFDESDRMQGYLVYDDVEDRCQAAEVGGDGEAVLSTILHHLARRAVRLRHKRISFSMPPDHAVSIYCRNFGLTIETVYERNAGPMGRVINLDGFLRQLAPKLALRDPEAMAQGLAVVTELGTVGIRVVDGSVSGGGRDTEMTRMRLLQSGLMQLAMGYCSAGDLHARGALQARKRSLGTLARLFPLQEAQMSWPDRF